MSAGRLLRYTFRGLLSVYSHYGLHARQVAFATLYTGGSSSFVTSAAAPIATGWSDPVPGRDLHPLLTNAFHGAQHSSTRTKHSSSPSLSRGRGLQGRGRGFDMGSITVPDRTLQRKKEPSVTLVFCKLRPSFSLSRQRSTFHVGQIVALSDPCFFVLDWPAIRHSSRLGACKELNRR